MVLTADNPSYKFLKKCGNNWKFDINKVHPKLVERLYKRFDTFDLNSDGTLKMYEIQRWPDRVRECVRDITDEEMGRLRSAISTFFGSMGVGDEGLKREDWVEGNQVLAEADFERKKRGEQTMVALLGNAYFDILDESGSSDVTMNELKNMMRVFEVPEEAAYSFFEHADTDKSGTLERGEMHAIFSKFWLEKYNPTYDDIYARKY